jgi:hypothetical protein
MSGLDSGHGDGTIRAPSPQLGRVFRCTRAWAPQRALYGRLGPSLGRGLDL